MKGFWANWNIFRILKLFIGIALIVEGFKTQGYVLILLGGVFALTTVLNMGCGTSCSPSRACISSKAGTEKSMDEITYEEIK